MKAEGSVGESLSLGDLLQQEPARERVARALVELREAVQVAEDGLELRGRVRADDDGRYHFETVRPGHYLNGDRYRPAHIHVKIGAAGHRPLTTQLYFPDDPHNAGDPFLVPSLIMDVRASTIGELASFDFVLTRG